MIAIVAAMGGEIEGDRQPLLPRREVAPVEGVGVLRGGEAGILAHGPRLGDIHRGVGAAHIGRHAGIGVEEVEPLQVLRAVDRLHRDALRGEPRIGGALGGGGPRFGEGNRGEIRDAGHGGSPHSSGRRNRPNHENWATTLTGPMPPRKVARSVSSKNNLAALKLLQCSKQCTAVRWSRQIVSRAAQQQPSRIAVRLPAA